MSDPQNETNAFIHWLMHRVYTLPDNWAAMTVTLVFFGENEGWSHSAYSYDRDGQSTPLDALSEELLFEDGYPNPFQNWLAAAHGGKNGEIPARAVLVQIINRGGSNFDPRIQVSADLEKWDLARYPTGLAQMIRPSLS